jgi:Ca2+-binding RTX toxin-like protein
MLASVLTFAPSLAAAGYLPGGAAPGACSGGRWADRIGTLGVDLLAGAAAPQRLYGLTGDDWMAGAADRPSCLFGGQGDDMLSLGAGGGIALGEVGADVLLGSELDVPRPPEPIALLAFEVKQ